MRFHCTKTVLSTSVHSSGGIFLDSNFRGHRTKAVSVITPPTCTNSHRSHNPRCCPSHLNTVAAPLHRSSCGMVSILSKKSASKSASKTPTKGLNNRTNPYNATKENATPNSQNSNNSNNDSATKDIFSPYKERGGGYTNGTSNSTINNSSNESSSSSSSTSTSTNKGPSSLPKNKGTKRTRTTATIDRMRAVAPDSRNVIYDSIEMFSYNRDVDSLNVSVFSIWSLFGVVKQHNSFRILLFIDES